MAANPSTPSAIVKQKPWIDVSEKSKKLFGVEENFWPGHDDEFC